MDEVLSALRVSAYIRIGDFDPRAAVEPAGRLRDASAKCDIREGLTITKSRMKFDRQIVAIAPDERCARPLYGLRWHSKVCGRLRAEREADIRLGDNNAQVWRTCHSSSAGGGSGNEDLGKADGHLHGD